jgi:hypothetical protein
MMNLHNGVGIPEYDLGIFVQLKMREKEAVASRNEESWSHSEYI